MNKLLAVGCLTAVLTAQAGFVMDRSVMSDDYWKVWNDAEQARIDADIEANRKADAVFAVDAPAGTPVDVEQISHDFRFGAHIFNFDQLGKKDWNDAYKASYGQDGIFNQATVAFYWNCYEPVPGRLRAFGDYEDTARFWNSLSREEAMEHPFWRRPAPAPVIDYLRSRGVAIHGHILIWGSAKPNWIYDWYCPESEKRAFDALGIPRRDSKSIPQTSNWSGGYNQYWNRCWRQAYAKDGVNEASIAAMAPIFVKRMPEIFRKRVFDVAKDFGEVVDSWDVVNESSQDWIKYRKSRTGLPVWKSNYGLMPGDYPLHALLDAKDAFPAKSRLAINDYNISNDFLAQVKDLESEGAKIDIVGCQMHLFNTNDCMRLALGATNISWVGTPQTIQARLDMMARTGKPLHVSEITITSPGADDRCRMIQAILTYNIYSKWFSHKALMGITWWNTVDGGGVKGEPLVSGLFTTDLKPKPAYRALDQLINHDWKTKLTAQVKGADGKIRFRGFCGRYRLSWKDASGTVREKVVELSPSVASEDGPKISVFSHSIEVYAKEKGLTVAEVERRYYDLGVRGFDSAYGNAHLAELAKGPLKPINLFGWLKFRAVDGGKAESDAFVATAVKYGVPRIMVIPDAFTKDGDKETEFRKILPGLRYLVQKAKENGVTVTVEDYGGTDNPCSYMTYLKRFLDEIPDLCYALDSGNMHYADRGENILDMMKYAEGRIAHVHLKDFQKGSNRTYTTIGIGEVPNEAIVRAQTRRGYAGWFTLENLVGDRLDDAARQISVIRRWHAASR